MKHLRRERLVFGEILGVQLVETLQGAIVGERSLVLGDLLPGGSDLWHTAFVYGVHEGLDH